MITTFTLVPHSIACSLAFHIPFHSTFHVYTHNLATQAMVKTTQYTV